MTQASDFSGGPVAKIPNAMGQGSIPGQGTRSHMLPTINILAHCNEDWRSYLPQLRPDTAK